jgi:hypothetical protein
VGVVGGVPHNHSKVLGIGGQNPFKNGKGAPKTVNDTSGEDMNIPNG